MSTPVHRPGRLLRALRIAGVPALLATFLLPALPPQAAAGEPGSAPFLVVRIDAVTPDVVTTGSDPVVTVTGAVANVGDRPVRDVVARLERAPAVDSSTQLRTDLDGNVDQFSPVAEFVDVSADLQRGQEAGFRFSYPLRSAEGPTLGFDGPGVYPMLVNVNGTPDYGEPARLDDARFLLPVLGLPSDPAAAPAAGVDGVIAPDTTKPVQITMLWPLADRPRLTPGVPGGTTPVRLMDDDLATSFAAGGRLDTLLAAAEFATSPTVDPGGVVTSAMCLAVDPDLLVTANAMTGDYVVADSTDGTDTASRPGTGQVAATAWLERLRALAGRMCVAATPYAQADLDALQRVGDPGLNNFSTVGAADLVDQILGVTSVRGAALVGDGQLTTRVADLLGAQGPTVAIAAADCTAQECANRAVRHCRSGADPAVATGGDSALRPERRCGACRGGQQPDFADLPRPVPGRAATPRFDHRPAPRRPGIDALAQPASRDRTAHPGPDAVADLESGRRRCAGCVANAGHHHPLGPGGPAAPAGGDRRRRRSARTGPAAPGG